MVAKGLHNFSIYFAFLIMSICSCSIPSEQQIGGGGPKTVNKRYFGQELADEEQPASGFKNEIDPQTSEDDPNSDRVGESEVREPDYVNEDGNDLDPESSKNNADRDSELEIEQGTGSNNIPPIVEMREIDKNLDPKPIEKKDEPEVQANRCLSVKGSKKTFQHRFTAKQADPQSNFKVAPGSIQQAYLDLSNPEQIEKSCGLIVYLAGAGKPKKGKECFGNDKSLEILGSQGHHVLIPCYYSYYGISNCKNDVGDCRLEAVEGTDHASQITVSRADSLEMRIVSALRYLQLKNPEGNWAQFIQGEGSKAMPAWDQMIVAGSSHGASTTALIAKLKKVRRAVMFSGPLDTDQAWTKKKNSKTPHADQFSLSCTKDDQHKGHQKALETLGSILPAFRYSGESLNNLRAKKPHHVIVDGACTHGNTGPREKFLKKSDGKNLYGDLWRYLMFDS